jgi:hypothetical protein
MKDNHVYPRQTDLGHTPGMELRDWFAGMVLQASCQENGRWEAARLAYEYADAMMEARNKEQDDD